MSTPQPLNSPPTQPVILRLGVEAAPLLAPAMLQPPGPLPQCPRCSSANVALHSRLAMLGYVTLGLLAFLVGFFVLMLTYLLGVTYLGDLIWLALVALPIVLYVRERRSPEGQIWAGRGMHCFNCGNQWLHNPGMPPPRQSNVSLPREVNERLRQIERQRPEPPPSR